MYTSHSEYAAHIQSTPSARSTRSTKGEMLSVLAVPALQNPKILASTGDIHSDDTRNSASADVPTEQKLETLRVRAVSAVHKPEVLRVHEVPPAFFLEKLLYSHVLAASVRCCIMLRSEKKGESFAHRTRLAAL